MHTLALRVRESFWFLPALLGIAAMVVAELLVTLDHALVHSATRIGFLDALSASGGRSILTTIGTSMLTVAGTSFSITISVLATTSSTYGPRLVRNFMADRANQFVLAAFTSTFLYSIVVLRSVHTDVDDGTAFVPVIAVHVAVLLGILDVAVLVFFIHHIASSVQITALQKQVQTDLAAAVGQVFRNGDGDGITVGPVHAGAARWADVTAAGDGYVQSVQWERLVGWATGHDCVIEAVAMPGDHVIEGDVLLRVGVAMDAEIDLDSAGRRLLTLVTLGSSRTPYQDVGFALQQLVEIAVRGLASGSNDPYTAVSALDLAATPLVPVWRGRSAITGYLDDDGRVRVIPHWPTAETLVDSVFDGVRTYGADQPIVVSAALRLAERLDERAPEGRRRHLESTVRALRAV
ncbi:MULTISPECIES: DUF2254 domain-containing protein [unclassified Curtobacterium]|uniref:DUF2254 domain-containing protein n=1 Tax=unclassified Curtobacterium TaxID=257496 RepID=UPI00104A6E4D|nr:MULTISPECIES: DUF2254 domain-containing protein [unclassified Curtobacterium]TCL72499.1 putative membrane protein [Curtobacterium sp. PhB128]TCL90606.1 putative membrane protein [Curtobacterium sp. PhB138]TCU81863.1 putative membrane protein [Curtobacterium sp. PhB191]TDW73564.1 putative membrane protein [Curtobacterium sp. PhB25]